MNTSERIAAYLTRVECALRAIDPSAVGRVVDALADTHAHGGNVFLCGNGGSASTASHMAADLAKGAPVGRVTGLRTVSLTDNVPIITAWGNDVDFSEVFAEQVRNLVRHRDALIAISASGNSPNILRAVEAAELQGAVTIGLCGFGGGRLAEMVDHAVIVTSDEYGPIEDVHLVLNHAIAESVRALRAVAPLVNHVGELR